MSTDYHTPHATAAPLTSAGINSPLAELDAGIAVAIRAAAGINVEEYGAVSGTVTDLVATANTTAIQNAIDANPYAVIYFPGMYRVMDSIKWYGEGQKFLGAGATGNYFPYIASGLVADMAKPVFTTPGGTASRYHGIHIEGMAFINNSTTAGASCVDLSGTVGSRLLNSVIMGQDTSNRVPAGLVINGPNYYPIISGTRFAYCTTAVDFNTGTYGGATAGPNGASIVSNSMSACDYGVVVTATIGVSVIGNTIDAYEAVGIRLNAGGSRCLVTGNYIEMNPTAPGSPANIWIAHADALDNQVSGNCHAGNGTTFVDDGTRTMHWDYSSHLKLSSGEGKNGLLMSEAAEPGAPAANQGVLFLVDNGAGKTVLKVRFASGASQTIATEP